ncbi:hypothetical protein SAMD00019534_077950 [Acytostelium subglobosum LB1]|uniref:hypothetical protein n=1 Tax=Acytostelium subglobosum LB1 TaxID=1410327 RepID=UPI000644A80B|nr:hypothetical protein SAMD00019534_077950 [Acytostelium subglobosum LB1]GAM24620.1 hypothetical protein SAMD00019534_077950 [Acytostelium subglobosum LB1]|eukprot:XP_012752289.1 hypothetical protein SAMD00019534_077950 [Acytostelium subglobosum LB1]
MDVIVKNPLEFDTITLSNVQTGELVTSLLIGDKKLNQDGLVFHVTAHGNYYLNTTKGPTCNSTAKLAISWINPVFTQPKCAFVGTSLAVTRPDLYVDGAYLDSAPSRIYPPVAIYPRAGAHKLMTNPGQCTIYFNVQPQNNLVPQITIKHALCAIANGTVTVLNANMFTGLSFQFANGTTVVNNAGVFNNVPQTETDLPHTLIAASTTCGTQRVPVTILRTQPSMSMEVVQPNCNASFATGTMTINGVAQQFLTNPTFTVKGYNFNTVYKGSMSFAVPAGDDVTVSYNDNGCTLSQKFSTPYNAIRATYTLSPAKVSCSSPNATITFAYTGNTSLLAFSTVDSGFYFKSSVPLDIPTLSANVSYGNYYALTSGCANQYSNIRIDLSRVAPDYTSTRNVFECMSNWSVVVNNYDAFSSVQLIRWSPTGETVLTSNTGIFQDMLPGSYILSTLEKSCTSLPPLNTSVYLDNPTSVIVNQYLGVIVTNHVPPPDCKVGSQGSGTFQSVYHGLPSTTTYNMTYYKSTSYLYVKYISSTCTNGYMWIPPKLTYDGVNATVTKNASCPNAMDANIRVYCPQNCTVTVDSKTSNYFVGYLDINGVYAGFKSITFSNAVTQCTNSITLTVPNNNPNWKVGYTVTNQDYGSCNVGTGSISIANPGEFNSITLTGYTVMNGVISGLGTGSYQVSYSHSVCGNGYIPFTVLTKNVTVDITPISLPTCFMTPNADGIVGIKLTNPTTSANIPIASVTSSNWGQIYPLYSYNNGTNGHIITNLPPNGSVLTISNGNCSWPITVTLDKVDPVPSFPLTMIVTPPEGVPSGVIGVTNPQKKMVAAIYPSPGVANFDNTQAINWAGLTQSPMYLSVVYNTFCQWTGTYNITPLASTKPVYTMTAAKCGSLTTNVTFDAKTMQDFYITIDGASPDTNGVITTTPGGYHTYTYLSYVTGATFSGSIDIPYQSGGSLPLPVIVTLNDTCGTAKGTIKLTGVNPAYTYTLATSGGQSIAMTGSYTWSGLVGTQDYALSIVDTNNPSCTGGQTVTIISNDPNFSPSSVGDVCSALDVGMGKINATVTNFNGVTYTIDNKAFNGVATVGAGIYKIGLSIADPICPKNFSYSVVIENLSIVSTLAMTANCGELSFSATGGNSNVYNLVLRSNVTQAVVRTSNGVKSTVFKDVSNGFYEVVITDTTGCKSISTSIAMTNECAATISTTTQSPTTTTSSGVTTTSTGQSTTSSDATTTSSVSDTTTTAASTTSPTATAQSTSTQSTTSTGLTGDGMNSGIKLSMSIVNSSILALFIIMMIMSI